MGYYDPDPYHQPEKFGLTILEVEDDPAACYSFNLFVLWQHNDGRLFYATDSGCSCPSPFESFDKLEDLTELTDWATFEQDVTEWATYVGYRDEPYAEGKHNLLLAAIKVLPGPTNTGESEG